MDYGINLTVQKDIIRHREAKRVGEYWVGHDSIYYELPYCKFVVHDLNHIVVTPAMLKLPTFLKWHNIDWLRQHLMQVKCVENGAVLIHGAAWKKNGIGYLAVGFANSGKTGRVLREMRDGAEFCSDENVIVEKGTILPVIRQSSISAWHYKEFGLSLTIKQKLELKLAKIRALCPLFESNIWVTLPYKRKSFRLDKIIYLTEGVHSLALLTDNEFPFYTNPVLQTYAYATGWDLDGVYRRYRELIKEVEVCGGQGSSSC